MSDTIKAAIITAVVTVALCAISVFGYVELVFNHPNGETTFEYNSQDHSVKMTTKDGKIDVDELLRLLTSTDGGLAAATDWFRRNRQMYSLTYDPDELIAAMTALCPVPNSNNATDMVDTLNACFQQHSIISNLRDRARSHNIPFEIVADSIRIGIPSNARNQPGKRRANACGDGKFFRHKVEVYDRMSARHYTVDVTGQYACSVGLAPDLQLNPADATWLFGSSNFDRTQDAYALVL